MKKNRYETRYNPKYEYEFNGMKYQATGEIDRLSTNIRFDHIQINPDNPYEIYEPDSYSILRGSKSALTYFVISYITYTVANCIGVDKAFEYISKFM